MADEPAGLVVREWKRVPCLPLGILEHNALARAYLDVEEDRDRIQVHLDEAHERLAIVGAQRDYVLLEKLDEVHASLRQQCRVSQDALSRALRAEAQLAAMSEDDIDGRVWPKIAHLQIEVARLKAQLAASEASRGRMRDLLVMFEPIVAEQCRREVLEKLHALLAEPSAEPFKIIADGPPCPTCGFRLRTVELKPCIIEDDEPNAEGRE